MIIKSHIRAGYRAAADYLKEQGKNEKIRLVEISDPDANNLDEAFRNMWLVANGSKVKKPLHHISINPVKGERLTDKQVLQIVERCEQKYGYKPGNHQRVIVEHVKDGRQHFHVMWCRVSQTTGKAVWPGEHWKKSKQVCREMEVELGLKRLMPKSKARAKSFVGTKKRTPKLVGYYGGIKPIFMPSIQAPYVPKPRQSVKPKEAFRPAMWQVARRHKRKVNMLDWKAPVRTREQELHELLIWAWENGRRDILYDFGIILPPDYEF